MSMFNNFYGSRSFTHDTHITNGKVTIDWEYEGKEYKQVITIIDRQVTEKKIYNGNGYIFWLKYGHFEKERKNGQTHKIMSYRNGTGKGKDGLCVRKDFKLEGYEGTCYTFFCNGRLLWQKFVYSNKVVGYYARHNAKEVIGRTPQRSKLFHIIGEKLNFKGNGQGEPFIYNQNNWGDKWNLSETKCSYTFWDKRGRVKAQGTYENNQRVGEWTEKYRKYYFISGVKISKKLFEMPSHKINPQRVLNEPNAQARAMLLKKIGLDRVVKKCKGKLIHTDKKRKNKLYDFPIKTNEKRYQGNDQYSDEEDEYDQAHIRILQVTCPTTKGQYFLRVPALPHWNTCEKARQGTFNGFTANAKNIKFERET